jgi:hypothetical protein
MAALTSSNLQVIFINHSNNLLYIQVVSEIGGHILDTRIMDKNRGGGGFHINPLPETLDVSNITNLNINTHEKKNIYFTKNNGPRIIILFLPLSSSHNTHMSLYKRCPKCPLRSVNHDAAFLILLIF